ncbi:hypothetical protein WA026_015149 [Henosepilachna vigintioctopunctata]|uniref:FP protein C-terminal domain-containing protein n=1 Tax=Henosepilachna vigintioctopunctata TaxID=420089 RepID=A0AAW1TNK3_9CUCU
MSQKTCQRISKNKEEWFCEDCKKDKASITDVKKKQLQGKEYTIADVMAKLELMDHKLNSLEGKCNEQVRINKQLEVEIESIKKTSIVVDNLAKKLQVNRAGGIKEDYRLGKSTDLIKIMFNNAEVKNKIVKANATRKLTAKDLGYNTDTQVYINNDLTKQNIQLLKAAKKFKEENNYKYLWVQEGNILLRKEDNSKIILIEDYNCLKN